MTYRIEGLDPAAFRHLFGAPDETLRAHRALRTVAAAPGGYPCRITLEEAEEGERLLLVHHVSNDPAGPFRMSHAVYIREGAETPGRYLDKVPELLDRRTLGLRALDASGALRDARLAMPGEAEAGIRALFAAPEIVAVHAHNAALGCFLARAVRD